MTGKRQVAVPAVSSISLHFTTQTMTSNQQKATQLLAEAEKKLAASGSFLRSLFGRSNKIEEAVECYQKAANLFKIANDWKSAGGAFCKAANLNSKVGYVYDTASNYVDAANCYKKHNFDESINCFLKAIEIYTEMGRFSTAAKHHQTIAEMYASDAVDLERALEHYEQAADYFKCGENNCISNKCLLKVAQYAAQMENYQKAIEIYERMAMSVLGCSLLKYSAKEYLFRAALCHLCTDLLNAQHASKRYIELYPAFQDSREYKFLQNLMEHLEEENTTGFAGAVKDYDSVSRFDQWYITILLRIKKRIGDDEPDLR